MKVKSFAEYVIMRESAGKNWKDSTHQITLQQGFTPPKHMRPIVEAFLNSSDIVIQPQAGEQKNITMPKKTLYLTGGSARDHVAQKTIREYHLATDATPEQIATILYNAGFRPIGLPPHKVYEEDGDEKKVRIYPDRSFRVGKRDSRNEAYTVLAKIEDDEFEIASLNKDPKTGVPKQVQFTDNPLEDSKKRDFTMNAMYIPLSKSDKPNTTLYDPTGTGYSDTVSEKKVRAVGKPMDRMAEDPLRALRAIRFHCRYGKGNMEEDTATAISRVKRLVDELPPDQVREEFLKGLKDDTVNPKCYIGNYLRTRMLDAVFPNVNFKSPAGMPNSISDQKDRVLAIAWLLQHNDVSTVRQALSSDRGWSPQERRDVLFLLNLLRFDPSQVSRTMSQKQATNLTNHQIQQWIEMFRDPESGRNVRGDAWKKQVEAMVGRKQRYPNWDAVINKGLDYGVKDSDRERVRGDLEASAFRQEL